MDADAVPPAYCAGARRAQAWIARGFRPIPLPPGQKKAVLDGWPKTDFGADLPRYFSQPTNLGVALGEPYGNIDIDLDCQEAIRIWPEFAPPTNMRLLDKSPGMC